MSPALRNIAAVTLVIAAFAGVNQLRAQTGALEQRELSRADIEIVHGLAHNFMSSKTDTPESDLAISPKALSISDSLFVVSFIGEDFSDHVSRIDRCYVALYDSSKRTISVTRRKHESERSEDSTPCTKIALYTVEKSGNRPWIAFISNYSNPQVGDGQDDDVVELYALDPQRASLCYDEKRTEEVNASAQRPTVAKIENFLSKKSSSSAECN